MITFLIVINSSFSKLLTSCPVCGYKRTPIITNGFYPKLVSRPEDHVFKTQIGFGYYDTYTTEYSLIVDKDIYDVFENNKIRGANFIPLANE